MKDPRSPLAVILLFIAGIILSHFTGFSLGASILVLLSPLALYAAYFFINIKFISPVIRRKNNEKLLAALQNHKEILIKHSLHHELPESEKMIHELTSEIEASKR